MYCTIVILCLECFHCYVIIIDCLFISFDMLYFSIDGCINKITYLLTYLLTPPTPLTMHARSPMRVCVLPASGFDHGIWLAWTAWGKRSAWSVERWPSCQYFYGFNFNRETSDMLHLKYMVILVLPMWYCRSRSHVSHAVSSAPHRSEKPLQCSYSHA